MHELGWILAGTLAGGVLSVAIAAFISLVLVERWVPRLVSFAVGVLLGVALLKLLPEAIETGLDPEHAGAWLLAGLLAFFAVEKLALWLHGHGHDATPGRVDAAAPMIVLGDGLHNFVDGVLIAAAFLQDTTTGIAVTLAVIAHEVPQEIGDFVVLLQSGLDRRRALLYNVLSSLGAVAGGVLGWAVFSFAHAAIPFALVLAAASFLYIAVANLVPVLHRRREPLAGPKQFALIALGIAVVTLGHHHHH